MPEVERDLAARVEAFAQELIDTASGILGVPTGFEVQVGASRSRPQIVVSQSDPLGVPILVDGQVLLRLLVEFRCRWNTQQRYLAVEQSTFAVRVEHVNEPLFHFDYVRNALESVPVAHLNVHAHRDEVVWAMMMARTKRGKRRGKDASKGKIPRISTLHFPLGGHRHRPSLEDVFDMLIQEFGIEHSEVAAELIAAGRRRFRSIQTAVGVHDDPVAAAGALEELGYTVRSPTAVPAARRDRLERY
ncbi:hypothetical protein [Curtobacterium sp. LFS082]